MKNASHEVRRCCARSPRRASAGLGAAVATLLSATVEACGPDSRQAGRPVAPATSPPTALATDPAPAPRPGPIAGAFDWRVVVNNGVVVPGDVRRFNSYNQPSVNVGNLVVFRARSTGGTTGEPAHGVFSRDMAAGAPVITVFDRNTTVPQPNDLGATIVEPPSFPRIDMGSSTIASRGNHAPVWAYTSGDGTESRAGTTGIYSNPFGDLIAGASDLGSVPGFAFFAVPGTGGPKFDVFPGAPSVTDRATLVFKGNYTAPGGAAKTGVYYRNLTNTALPLADGGALAPAGGTAPVVVIADRDTPIPGTTTPFGSTAPPSAAGRVAVFAGFDDENAPTLGGIYLAPLTGPRPKLTPLVKIGANVPGERKAVFSSLGEGVSFDGRFVAFWAAWGTETRTLTLPCPSEGNALRVAYCQQRYPDGFQTQVPVHQGIFVDDVRTGTTVAVAKAPTDFDDFVYWNYSGRVPGMSESEEVGEEARWRSGSFVAVSGLVDGTLSDRVFHAVFKARTGQVVDNAYVSPVDGVYLRKGPGAAPIVKVLETGMDGTAIDPAAVYVDAETGVRLVLPVTEMGLERDGFRGASLVVNVGMGTEDAGWAGIYLTTVPEEEP